MAVATGLAAAGWLGSPVSPILGWDTNTLLTPQLLHLSSNTYLTAADGEGGDEAGLISLCLHHD